MFQSGKGWGQIAKELNLESSGIGAIMDNGQEKGHGNGQGKAHEKGHDKGGADD